MPLYVAVEMQDLISVMVPEHAYLPGTQPEEQVLTGQLWPRSL